MIGMVVVVVSVVDGCSNGNDNNGRIGDGIGIKNGIHGSG